MYKQRVFLDLSPLKNSREYRLLFIGQLISFLGSMVSYVAVPYQVYQISHSSMAVGMIGVVQLVPVLLFSLLGGAVADRMDRRRLLFVAELVMSVGALGLLINASRAAPSLAAIYVLCAFIQAANGFHRPAMEALTQKVVDPKDYTAISALGAIRYSAGAIAGPALGGVLVAAGGASLAYMVDFFSFLFSAILIFMMRPVPVEASAAGARLRDGLKEGLTYALRHPVLMGTCIVDITAMTFAMPTALFPAMGAGWGGAKAAGLLFSAMSVGALLTSATSAWAKKVKRHGRAVVLAAGAWGVAIIALAYAPNLEMALFWLVVAGAADMVSALFRGVIWNETVPNAMRGRLSGLEMIGYMTGPLLGNARAGWMASTGSVHTSILWGGVMCVAGIAICAKALPSFWLYASPDREN